MGPGESLPGVWNHFWGYLVQQNIAPVLIGEFGSTLANPLDTQWMNALMSYSRAGPTYYLPKPRR